MAQTRHERFLEAFHAVRRRIHEGYHRGAQEAGLTLEQYHLLLELDELALTVPEGAPPMGVLARAVDAAPNTLSERVDRLEKLGLVVRLPDARDRRVIRVAVSEAGQAILEGIEDRAERHALTVALEAMPEAAYGPMVEGLETLRATMEAQERGR